MARIHVCDHCGEQEETTFPLAVLSPRKPPQERPAGLFELMGRAEHEEDRFDLCASCAMSLIMLFKSRRLKEVRS